MKYLKFGVVALFMAISINATAAEVDLSLVVCKEIYIDLEETESGRIPPSEKGSKHYLKVPTGVSKAKLKEEKRKSRISEDLATIVKIASEISDIKAAKAVPQPQCVEYTQGYKRTKIEVRTLDASDKELSSHTLIAGPAEHFYLSADMPVTSIKQLSYDSGTNSVIEKEKPASFYLGINAKVGDVFTNYPVKEFYKDISFKALVKASSKPSESMGLGIGYNFKVMEVFVARVWTKDDESVGGTSLGNTPSTIFGVSFNLTKGLNWLKGGE